MFIQLKPEDVSDEDIQVLIDMIHKLDALDYRSELSKAMRKIYYTLGNDEGEESSVFIASLDNS